MNLLTQPMSQQNARSDATVTTNDTTNDAATVVEGMIPFIGLRLEPVKKSSMKIALKEIEKIEVRERS